MIEEICKAFPIDVQFNFVHESLPVELMFDASFGQDERGKLVDELRSWFINIVPSHVYNAMELKISKNPSFPAILQLQDGRKCYFPEGNAGSALSWTVFGFATNAPWCSRLAGKVITVSSLSSPQQHAALDVLERIRYQSVTVYDRDSLYALFEKLTRKVSMLCAKAPLLCDSPFSEAAYKSTHFLGSPKSLRGGRLSDLLDMLYGTGDIFQLCESFADILFSSKSFAKSLKESRELLTGYFHTIPCSSAINSIAALKKLADEKYHSDDGLKDDIIACLEDRVSAFKPSRSAVAQKLSRLQGCFDRYIEPVIGRRFFSELLSNRFEISLREEQSMAAKKMERFRRELLPFCRLYRENDAAEIPVSDWSEKDLFESIPNLGFERWTPEDIEKLIGNLAGAQCFLLPEQSYNLMSMEYRNDPVFPVPVMDRLYFWAIRADPFHGEVDYGAI